MPLGKRVDFGDAKYAGLEVPYSCSLVEALKVIPLPLTQIEFPRCSTPQRAPSHSFHRLFALQDAQVCGLDFLLVPLADPSHRRRSPKSLPPSDELLPPFTRSDLLLTSAEWSSQVSISGMSSRAQHARGRGVLKAAFQTMRNPSLSLLSLGRCHMAC